MRPWYAIGVLAFFRARAPSLGYNSEPRRTTLATDLLALAREVLPRDLWPDFERSLGTPQRGPYHNEGPFMDSHLRLVLAAIEAVGRGEFHSDVPEGVRPLMHAAAARYGRLVPMYVLLHDLDKITCLTFVYSDGRKVPVPYEKWQEMLHDDPDGPAVAARDSEALQRFCERRGIKQISYYQNLGGGDRTHGRVTASGMRGRHDVPRLVVQAIATHEVAYLFKDRGGLNIPLFDRTFGNCSEIQLGFALLVNYADQMGALQPNGQPTIASFVALARTYLAIPKFWEIHRLVMAESGRLDETGAVRRGELFMALWRSTTLLETEAVDDAVTRIVAACTATSRG